MIPPFSRFMLPLLKALSDGGEHRTADLVEAVSRDLGLSEEQRGRVMPSKRNARMTYAYNRLAWAKTHMQRAGLLEMPGRGLSRITRQGLDVLKDPPGQIDLKYLRGFGAYREWMETFASRRPDRGRAGADERADGPGEEGGDMTPEDAIQRGVEELRAAAYSDLLDEISKISPSRFEVLVLDLLGRMEYGEVEHTGRSGDGGFDGVIHEDRLGLGKIYIQCKRYKGPVPVKEVRDFVGALSGHGTKKGVFVAASKFTRDAEEYIRNMKTDTSVILIDGRRLVELMYEHGLGVSREKDIAISKVDRGYFEEPE